MIRGVCRGRARGMCIVRVKRRPTHKALFSSYAHVETSSQHGYLQLLWHARREHNAGRVAQPNSRRQVDGLKVLGVAWCARAADDLLAY